MTLFTTFRSPSTFARVLDELYFENSNSRSNVTISDDNRAKLEIELAGYKKEEIEIYMEKNYLYVKAKKTGSYNRSYSRYWSLTETEKVGSIQYENGLLSIEILRVIPDEQKRKNYTIE